MLDYIYQMTLEIFCKHVCSNEFDKFNNTGVRMLDSIYQMALEIYL